MNTLEQVIATYFRAWNETDDERRSRFVAESCDASVAYVDPKYTCSGVEELARRIQRSRQEAPSFRVDVTSALDGYGDTFRYTWLLEIPDMKLRVPGLDVLVRAKDGRIGTLTSFFGALELVQPGAKLKLQRWAM